MAQRLKLINRKVLLGTTVKSAIKYFSETLLVYHIFSSLLSCEDRGDRAV